MSACKINFNLKTDVNIKSNITVALNNYVSGKYPELGRIFKNEDQELFKLFLEGFIEKLSNIYYFDKLTSNDLINIVSTIVWDYSMFSNLWNKPNIKYLKRDIESMVSSKVLEIIDSNNSEHEIQESVKVKDTSEQFLPISTKLKVLFGNQSAIISYLKKSFVVDMRKALVFDRDKGPTSRSVVGERIARYKNLKYKLLRDYLLSDPVYHDLVESTPKVIYLQSGQVDVKWKDLLLIAQKKFYGENFISLNKDQQLESIKNYCDKLILKFLSRLIEENALEVEAYVAFTMLNPRIFDDLLGDTFKDNISIKQGFLGETDVKNNKYELIDNAKYSTGWSDDEENKEALTLTSPLLDILIEGTQLRSIRSKKLLQGRFLAKQSLLNFFQEVKNRARNIDDTEVVEAFLDFRDNPLYNITVIVKRVTESNQYSSTLRNIALTLLDEFFDDESSKSLVGHTLYNFSAVSKNYTLLDALVGLVDRMSETAYLFFGEDPELGHIKSQIISTSSSGRIKGLLIKKINNNVNRRSDIVKTYNVTLSNDGYSNVSFDLTLADDKTYRFTSSGSSRSLAITDLSNNKLVNFSDLFSSELNSEDLYNELLGGITNAIDKKNSIILLKLIDNVLGTRFTKGEADLFSYFCDNYGSTDSSIQGQLELVRLLNDGLSILTILTLFKTSTDGKSFENFINSNRLLYLIDAKKMDAYVDYTNDTLSIYRLNSKIIDNLVTAQQLVTGEYYSSMVGGVNGNNVAKFKKTTLALSIEHVISKLAKFEVYSGSILSRNTGVIKDVVVSNGMKLRGLSKLAKDFRPSEWYHSGFMYDYLEKMFVGKEGSYLCMPVVYSDKTTFFKYQIGLKFKVFFGGDVVDVDLRENSVNLLLKAAYLNRSQTYQQIYDRVDKATSKILQENITRQRERLALWILNKTNPKPEIVLLYETLMSSDIDLNTKEHITKIYNKVIDATNVIDYNDYETLRALMHLININTYHNLAFLLKIDASENLYYQERSYEVNGSKGTFLDLNVSLHYMAKHMFNATSINDEISDEFSTWFNIQQRRAVKAMLEYGNYFEMETGSDDLFIGDADIFKAAFDKLGIQFSDWLRNNRLVFVKVKKGKQTYYILKLRDLYLLDEADEIEYNPLISKFLATDVLTLFDLRNALVGTELQHLNKGGKEEQQNRDKLYNSYDILSSMDLLELVMMDVNQMDLSSAKRTVNIGATINLYQRANILGISLRLRRAVFYDIKGPVFGPKGPDKSVDAHDGGSKGSPLEMRLRNYSLQNEQIKGTISKSIEISYTESGALILDKYALHGITNLEIRESLGSEMNLLNLTRRMHGIRFFKQNEDGTWIYNNYDELDAVPDGITNPNFDITTDFLGNKINLKEVTNSKAFYYDPNTNEYYKLIELTKIEGNDPTQYELTVQKVDEAGNAKQGEEAYIKLNKRINCLYDLWQAFGGCYSMTLGKGNKLEYSDVSWDIVAVYTNAVGLFYGKRAEDGSLLEIPNLYNTWLPLKNKFIGALDVHSAVKNGSYSINPTEKYYTQKLNEGESYSVYEARMEKDLMYMIQDTTFSGELLDATHLLNDGEVDVTLPTLVMAALENGGYSHDTVKRIYTALGLLVINERKELIDSIEKIIKDLLVSSGEAVEITSKLFESLKSDIYEILVEIGIRAAKHDDFGPLTTSINRIQKEVLKKHKNNHDDDPIYLPLSDSTLFQKLVADYVSSINKKAIKHRSSGFAAVISPSYKMVLLYRLPIVDKDGNVDMHTHTYSEIEQMAIKHYAKDEEMSTKSAKEKVDKYLLELHNKQEPRSLNNVLPGLNIVIVDRNGGIVEEINTEDWKNYKKVKDYLKTHPDYKFKINILKPSDLLPMQLFWSNGKQIYSFYDIPVVRQIFDIRSSNIKLTKRQNQILDEYILSVLNIIEEAKSTDNKGDKFIPKTIFEESEETHFETLSSKLDHVTEQERIFIVDGQEIKLPTAIPCRRLTKNESVTVHDAELVVPNYYADKFGMSYNTPLNEVLAQGAKFFERQYKLEHVIPDKTPYNICFTRSSGKNTYFVLKDSFVNRKYLEVDFDHNNYKWIGNDYVRIDDEGNKLYVAGTKVDGELQLNITEYIAENGEAILVLNKPEDIKQFLKKDDYDDIRLHVSVDAESALKFSDIIGKYDSDYTTLFKTITALNTIIKNFITNDNFTEEHLRSQIPKRLIEKDNKDFNSYIDLLVEAVSKTDKRKSESTKNKEKSILQNRILLHAYRMMFNETMNPIIERNAKMKFAAFQRCRSYIAARIPAQTQQSFMKMRTVAFVQGLVNNAYVSRYLTWLLGSDYDIDKAYLLGHELSSSGKYLTHSPLSIIDSIEGIKLSEQIPIPDASVEFKRTDDGENINVYLKDIRVNKDKKITKTRDNLYIFIRILKEVKNPNVSYSEEYKDIGDEVIKLLNKHNLFFVTKNYKTVERILNNVSLLGIELVISAPINYRFSHTPIEIVEPKTAANNSTLGKEAKNTTLSNPYDRWQLTVQNMTGRDVIGIAAIGEKIFFGVTHILNEAILHGNIEDFKNILFKFKFSDIDDDGKKIETVRHIFANINFHKFEQKREELKRLIEKYVEDPIIDLQQALTEEFELQSDQALIISELLSAATDNAKELILEKINSGSLTAGLYLHLIILGIDFDKIARYMTGPLVAAVSGLAERQVNTFNSTTSRSRNLIKNLAKALLGEINVRRFLDYSTCMLLAQNLGSDKDDPREVLEDFIKELLSHDRYVSLDPKNQYEYIPAILQLLEYLDELAETRELLKKVYGDDLNNLLKLFIELSEGANETTLMGKIFSSNLGMRTNATELILWILSINLQVESLRYRLKDRIAEYDKEEGWIVVDNPDTYHTKEEVKSILETAEKFDIIENFDLTKFIFGTEEYLKAAVEYYSLIKFSHNILYNILHMPQLKNTIKLFCATNLLFKTNIATYRMTEAVLKKMSKMKKYVDVQKRSIIELFSTGVLISHWLEQYGSLFKIKLAENDVYFKVNGSRDLVKEGQDINIDFSTPLGIATFKHFVELVVYDRLKLSEKLSSNLFVDNLSIDDGLRDKVTRDRVDTLIIANFDMMSDFGEVQQAQYDAIVSDFALLKGYTLRDLGLDSDLSIIDTLALYNLIVNKNLQGSTRLTRLILEAMDTYKLKISALDSWYNFVGRDLDYKEIIDIIASEGKLDEFLENLSYYLASTKGGDTTLKWNTTNRRYDATYRYKDKNGKTQYINFAKDLKISKDMSNYFVLDFPISRFKRNQYDLSSYRINDSTPIITLLILNNILKITFYCE